MVVVKERRARSEESEVLMLTFELHASYHFSSITGHPSTVLPLTPGGEKTRVGVISNRGGVSSVR